MTKGTRQSRKGHVLTGCQEFVYFLIGLCNNTGPYRDVILDMFMRLDQSVLFHEAQSIKVVQDRSANTISITFYVSNNERNIACITISSSKNWLSLSLMLKGQPELGYISILLTYYRKIFTAAVNRYGGSKNSVWRSGPKVFGSHVLLKRENLSRNWMVLHVMRKPQICMNW